MSHFHPRTYPRTRFAWIRARARRIQRFYKITRRLAVYDAWQDWITFQGIAQSVAQARSQKPQQGVSV
jgi:hypothetical protein